MRTCRRLLTLLTAIVPLIMTGTSGAVSAQQGPPSTVLSRQQREDLRFFAAILNNPANDAETWTGAARRLLQMQVPQAVDVLDDVLRSGDAPRMLAVIEAMLSQPQPAPALLDAAVDALRTAPPEVLNRLSILLIRYEDAAIDRVGRLATNPDVPVAERLGAVHALAAFPTRRTGDLLLRLADPAADEPAPVRAAAFESLRRLSGLDLGDEFVTWSEWWTSVRDVSPEQWTREMFRRYRMRIADLEASRRRLAERYVDVLRELYRTLNAAEQRARLENDLGDELAPVRAFAMDRVARLLRDSEPIGDAIRAELVSRLDDEVPALRRKAAALLDELVEPELNQMIAKRLPDERDPYVVEGYLEILARRPTSRATDTIAAWLSDEALGKQASEALWAILATTDPSHDQIASVREAVRHALAAAEKPHLWKLLTLLGDEADLERAIPLLDAESADLRTAIAQALCQRGLADPLLERAEDPAIYPSLLCVLTHGEPDFADFQQLMSLAPPAEQRERWADAVREIAHRLPAERLAEADELLMTSPAATPSLRAAVLEQVIDLPADAVPPTVRGELSARFAVVLIKLGEAQRAFEFLDLLSGPAATPAVVEARFAAATFAGRYDEAALIHDEPEAWIDLLESAAREDEQTARRLRDEIARRYGEQLAGELRTQFEALDEQLGSPAQASGAESPSPS
jgi:hypothetical protein